MASGPRTPVEAQPAAAPRFGLIASIPPVDLGRWETGIAYVPEGCNEGETFDLCDLPELTENSVPEVVEWDPYVISVTEKCSTFGGDTVNSERAVRALNADTERQLGLELWDGEVAQATTGSPNTWLSDSSDANFIDLTGSQASGYVNALACLEQYLADNNGGQQGAIHATAQIVTSWESFRLLRREGNRILTFKDTVIIPSPGYTGSSPTGPAADGDIWAYATDMPRIFLSSPTVAPVLSSTDRQDNTVLVVAQRFGLVEWQRCRHAGIQLDVNLCGSGY